MTDKPDYMQKARDMIAPWNFGSNGRSYQCLAETLEALDTANKTIELQAAAADRTNALLDTERAAHEATKADHAEALTNYRAALVSTERLHMKAEAELQALRESVPAIRAALDYAGRNICAHEDTERGGFIWTICQQCGAKWADDQGGFEPSIWPEILDAAMDALRSLLPAPEPDPLVMHVARAISIRATELDAEAPDTCGRLQFILNRDYLLAEAAIKELTRHSLTIAAIGGKHD